MPLVAELQALNTVFLTVKTEVFLLPLTLLKGRASEEPGKMTTDRIACLTHWWVLRASSGPENLQTTRKSKPKYPEHSCRFFSTQFSCEGKNVAMARMMSHPTPGQPPSLP